MARTGRRRASELGDLSQTEQRLTELCDTEATTVGLNREPVVARSACLLVIPLINGECEGRK